MNNEPLFPKDTNKFADDLFANHDKHFNSVFKIAKTGMGLIVAIWVMGVLVSLTLIGLIVYVAAHFISKVW